MKIRHVFICLALVCLGLASCKKAIEQQYDDILKKMMVDGSWIITGFTEDSTDISSSFNGWICKFHDNNTMSASNGSAIGAGSYTGTWQSNLNAQTISAQFSGTVAEPLNKINGTWTIVSTATNKGKFAQTRDGKIYTMELTKY